MPRIQHEPRDFEPTGIIVTYEELLEYFDQFLEGADYAQAAEEGVLEMLKHEHGFSRYDDIELIIEDGNPPIDAIIETHIWCLEVQMGRILAELTDDFKIRVTPSICWMALNELNNGFDSDESFHDREGLEWMLDLFQVDMTYEDAIKKYGAKIEQSIQEQLDWHVK